jgi:hypothetical protein
VIKIKTKTVKAWKVLKKGTDVGAVSMCYKGLHASKLLIDAISFVAPGIICAVECKNVVAEKEDKFVCTEMRVVKTYRFTKPMCVEFAVYSAKQCLKNFEKYDSKDKRPRKAIEAAETYLRNPTKKNRSAVWFAAWSAWFAAWSAWFALFAAWSTDSDTWSAWFAAWSAWFALFAARSARPAKSAAKSAKSAACSAAWSAESNMKQKLEKKLLKIIKHKMATPTI